MTGARVMLALGALMLIGAAAGFIILPEHRPIAAGSPLDSNGFTFRTDHAFGLSQTVYDALRIATWALVIVGALVVAIGLIRYWRMAGRSP